MDLGEPHDLELELITANGRMLVVHALGNVRMERGKPVALEGSFQDI
jgi:hypothetical protein